CVSNLSCARLVAFPSGHSPFDGGRLPLPGANGSSDQFGHWPCATWFHRLSALYQLLLRSTHRSLFFSIGARRRPGGSDRFSGDVDRGRATFGACTEE